MDNSFPQQKSIKEIDFGYYISHYFALLLRWKWYILISGPITGLLVGLIAYKVIIKSPELSSKAIIGIEESARDRGGSITPSGWEIGASCVEQIKSKKFLEKIIDTLNLQFVLYGLKRNDVVDHVVLDSVPLFGKYKYYVNLETDTYRLTFVEKEPNWIKGEKGYEKVILSGNLSTQAGLEFPGAKIVFTDYFLQNPQSFTFNIVSSKYVLQYLSQKLIINPPNIREGKNIITISSYGTDYELITDIINSVADYYIKTNFKLKKNKLEKKMQQLELQFNEIRSAVTISERNLSAYRSSNPTVGITVDNRDIFDNLIDVDESNTLLNEKISESIRLIKLFNNNSQLKQTTREALSFLVSHDNISAIVLLNELDQLEMEQVQLKTTYGESHPLRIENVNKIESIRKKSAVILKRFHNDIKEKIQDQKNKKSQLTRKLKVAPAKELHLAKLMRKQEINSRLYSEVLANYNEAKVAYSSLLPSFYIMDYAEIPIEPGKFSKYLQLLILMCFAGLMISFGPMILVDVLDKRIWDGKQLEKLLKKPLLESIPLMNFKKIKSKDIKSKDIKSKDIKSMLITPFQDEYELEPYFIKETFRSLQAKILYKMETIENRTLAITSLESGDGKSIIASNIALAIAKFKKRVLIIDADMRRGNIHKLFNVENDYGITNLLQKDEDVDSNSLGQYIKATAVPDLFVLPRGKAVSDPEDILNSEIKNNIVDLCNVYFDYIIIDTAPIGAVTDAFMLDDIISRYLLVAYAGKTNGYKLNKRLDEFELLNNDKILGLVLNAANREARDKYKNYGAYYSNIENA